MYWEKKKVFQGGVGSRGSLPGDPTGQSLVRAQRGLVCAPLIALVGHALACPASVPGGPASQARSLSLDAQEESQPLVALADLHFHALPPGFSPAPAPSTFILQGEGC